MAEFPTAHLKPSPAEYKSSRTIFDVLINEDTALPLMDASSTGNSTTLKCLLSQSHWTKIAFEKPHSIYYQTRPSHGESDVRHVSAMPMRNLERAIIKAAQNGHATAVSTLLGFAIQQEVKPSSAITRFAVDRAIKNGHEDVIEVMVQADPTVLNFPLGHGTLPLDLAVKRCKTEVVAVLLQLGADHRPRRLGEKREGYRSSLLSLAARAEGTRMTELFLEHGASVALSGALHLAAEVGALDTMRLLMQHGADVNEQLPDNSLPVCNRALLASWTPIHFAASHGQAGAMKLLESNGARSDVKDKDGKTPAQLLERK